MHLFATVPAIIGSTAIGVAIGAALVSAQSPSDVPKLLKARELEVVNDKGQSVIRLSGDTGRIEILSPSEIGGENRVLICVGDGGGGVVIVRNANGEGTVVLRTDHKTEGGVIEVWDYDPKLRRSLEAQ